MHYDFVRVFSSTFQSSGMRLLGTLTVTSYLLHLARTLRLFKTVKPASSLAKLSVTNYFRRFSRIYAKTFFKLF